MLEQPRSLSSVAFVDFSHSALHAERRGEACCYNGVFAQSKGRTVVCCRFGRGSKEVKGMDCVVVQLKRKKVIGGAKPRGVNEDKQRKEVEHFNSGALARRDVEDVRRRAAAVTLQCSFLSSANWILLLHAPHGINDVNFHDRPVLKAACRV